jgi:hypothetical protein
MYGKAGEVGIGLVEIYDLDSGATSTCATSVRVPSLSRRQRPLRRHHRGSGWHWRDEGRGAAIGPSLQSSGLPGALDDTTLEVVDANGTSTTNDDWQQSPNAGEIQQAGLAPSDTREAAVMLPSLAAGPHTAIVRGKGKPSGVGVVEIYNLQ